MGKINDLLVAGSEKYVTALFADNPSDKIIFHNLQRIMQVKGFAEVIATEEGLDASEMDLLRVCAWFFQSGYVRSFDRATDESISLASAFLSDNGVEPVDIIAVAEIIRSAQIPYRPGNRVASVLCDANLMFLASEGAFEEFDLLVDENVLMKPFSGKRAAIEKEWMDHFVAHSYFTEYGKNVLQPMKERALQRLSDRMKRRKTLDSKKESPEKSSIVYTRGVETMFRITARNQINLNSIADNKSNILISVNAIIISIIITMLAGNIGNMSKDIVPILVFLLVCLVTIIIAILSTRPNIVMTRFTEEDLRNKNVDLIFFGNFCKLPYDEYLQAVKDMMKDEDHVYATLIKNQYSLGRILSKKFRLVRIAYNVFMIGIIFTVLVFLINFMVTRNPV
jgi:hypothetical protein